MKILGSILLLVLTFSVVNAQKSVPVFASKTDSANYFQLQAELAAIRKNQGEKRTAEEAERMDSLGKAFVDAMRKIVYFRLSYEMSNGFTSYKTITTADAAKVTKLSIHDYAGKKFPKNLAA
ncbi:MAG: hypothetical protein O9262_11285, partial [Cyclobacteriaceae bacterium]|nr:hypothetical protein [Cyclobacteriaceae bacterium]